MAQEQIIELITDKVDNEGRAIARDQQNRVILIENALPKSKVRVEVTEEKKNFAFAKVVETIEKSPYSISAQCSQFESCGGCTWQNLDYKYQLEYKKQILVDALTRIGKISLESPLLDFEVKASQDVYEYRNKMEFAFADNGEKTVIGLKSSKSHKVISVDCKLTDKRVNTVIHRLESLVNQLGKFPHKIPVFEIGINKEHKGFLRYAVTRLSHERKEKTSSQAIENTSEFLLEIITFPLPEYNQDLYTICRQLKEEFPFITGVVHSTRKNLLPVAYGEKTIAKFGETSVIEELNLNYSSKSSIAIKLKYSHQAFFQVNTKATSELYSAIARIASSLNPKNIADIYCGIGGIGIALATALKIKKQDYKIFGLESMPQAVKLAELNAKRYKVNAEYTHGNAKQLSSFLRKIKNVDLILLDPPRAGIDKETMQTLLRAQVKNIILISCNPASLARDLQLLQEKYSIQSLEAFDFFPHTPHVETLVSLVKK